MKRKFSSLLVLVLLLLLPLGSLRADEFANEAVVAAPLLVKATAGRLYGWSLVNLATAPAYLHFYDAASTGAVTVGTTPQVYMLPVTQTGFLVFSPHGSVAHDFKNGIVIAVTTSPLSGGTTAPNVGLVTFLAY